MLSRQLRKIHKQMQKYLTLSNVVGFVFIIGFILPTSNKEFTINTAMWRFCYFLLDFTSLVVLFYEYRFSLRRIILGVSIISILVFFTLISSLNYSVYELHAGNLLFYISFIICSLVTFSKIKANEVWDKLFICMMIIIAVFVIGTILGVESLNGILRKYYVSHLSYFLEIMVSRNKPVSFYTSHSMAAFIYSLFIVTLYIRNKYYKKSKINILLILIFVIGCIYLKSNSGIMVLGIIFVIYICSELKKGLNAYSFILIISLIVSAIIYLIINSDILVTIFSSDVNGLAGRYSLEGALSNSIRFILDFKLPTGLNDIFYYNTWLQYRDSSYLINMMRGGIVLTIIYIIVYVKWIDSNLKNGNVKKIIMLLLLLFEVGYPVSWEHRFLTAILFELPYLNFLLNYNKPCQKIKRCFFNDDNYI